MQQRLLLLVFFVVFIFVAAAVPSGDDVSGNFKTLQRPNVDAKGRPLRHGDYQYANKNARLGDGGGTTGLWPIPKSINSGQTEVPLDPLSFGMITESSSIVLRQAIDRYSRLMFPFTSSSSKFVMVNDDDNGGVDKYVLTVSVDSNVDNVLALETDESYTLVVETSGATLTAPTVFGAMHGLETMSQLVKYNDSTGAYSLPELPIKIDDAPRYPWRGLLIDVSRHFLPLSVIKHTIDAMSYNKLNVLHIHFTDAQSIPLQSQVYPKLTDAAYSPKAIYSTRDLKDLVAYAMSRGVRVVPEFEMPGHAFGFSIGYPFMKANCPPNYGINTIPLDPSSDQVYEFLLNFLAEMSTIFPDEFIHTGGDEVVVSCWTDDKAIWKWAQSMNFTDPYMVWNYFSKRMGTIVRPTNASTTFNSELKFPPVFSKSGVPYVNRTMVVWQDTYDDNYASLAHKEMIVEVDRDQGSIRSAVNSGYRALYAYPYYLDQQEPGTDPKPTFYQWADTWMAFYNADPTTGLNLTQAQEEMVLGGEGCMWGENVDGTNIDSRVWPRQSAIAERLWSPRSYSNAGAAGNRLSVFRCNSLARRRIGAGPPQPNYCPLPWDE